MTTRRTLIFTGKEQVELIQEPMPEPGPNELLVATERTLISTGTEGIIFARNFSPGTHWDNWIKYPFRPGYLNAGRVVAVGADVSGWQEGDHVASRANHSSHVTVPADGVGRIPEGVAAEDAAFMGLGKITQLGVRRAEHQLGDSVVIIGLGLLGQLVTQYVALMGAREIIAIDTAPKRLEMAKAHGASLALQMTAAEALEAVRERTGGQGADVVYDITGHAAVFATALPLARQFGTLVLLGDTGQPEQQTLTPDVMTRGVKIVGAHDSHAPGQASPLTPWSSRAIEDLFLHYLGRSQMRMSDLITHRFRPEQAADAYGVLQRERATAMGVVFEWD